MPSYSTTITPAGDGYADVYLTRLLSIADTYSRKEVKEYGRTRFRFYANDFNELYHIRSFNPQVGSNMIYGLSPLNAVFYEMRQYVEAAKSNLSFLNRAVKLSGVWTYDGMLSDQQRQELERQINAAYAGSNNVGRNALLDKKVTFTDATKNARDMDYMKTVEHTAQAIYKALDIPLPLVNAENMTYDNYESSQFYLFKDAVIPLTQRLFQEITNFLMPRYEDSQQLEIAFNPKDIPQLEPERNTQMKIKKETGIYTINEMRKESEAEPLDGGQFVYGTMGSIPIATDDNDEYAKGESNYSAAQETEQSEEKPIKPEEENIEESEKADKRAAKEEFIRRLKLQVNKDGTSRFTEEDIQELVQRHYGD
jgi:HK97 family phage portal protein